MIQWREQPADFGPQPLDALYRSLPLTDALRISGALDEPRSVFPLLIVECAVRDQVLAHLHTSHTELGGLLIGDAFVRTEPHPMAGQISVVRIREAIPGHDYASTSVSLQLGTSVWDKARNRIGDGRLVIGWYHSHPHLGAFFSGTDRRTQRAFFAHPYSIGWVVDPYATDPASTERFYVGPQARALPDRAVAGSRTDL